MIFRLIWDFKSVGVEFMKRIISAIICIFLIGVVIYLGIKSGDDSKYIVPFGLTSALITTMGLSALGYSIRRKDELKLNVKKY